MVTHTLSLSFYLSNNCIVISLPSWANGKRETITEVLKFKRLQKEKSKHIHTLKKFFFHIYFCYIRVVTLFDSSLPISLTIYVSISPHISLHLTHIFFFNILLYIHFFMISTNKSPLLLC